MTQQNFLIDLFARRGKVTPGFNPEWIIELEGAEIIAPTAFEPDPNTHRDQYYYNAATNTLNQKITTIDTQGLPKSTWKRISN